MTENTMIRARENLIGAWAFSVGIILAIVVGIFAESFLNTYTIWILIGLGILIGYFVAEKDVSTFLLASVSLVLAAYVGISGLVINAAIIGANLGRVVSSIMGALLILFVPATIVVAMKTVFSISKS